MPVLRNRDRQDDGAEQTPQWQTIYCSLMLLLMVFFVMIAVWSTVEARKMAYARNIAETPKIDTGDAIAIMQKYSELTDLKGIMALEQLGGGFKAVVQTPVLFDSGRGDLNPNAYAMLREISRIANESQLFITIEGHTDNTPVKTAEYPSNWELSTLRAVNVLRFLHHLGVPADRLSAVGYGEYRPLMSNDTEAGRQKNRRIEIIFRREAQ
ncbi:MAG: flagellar motor protein MotB [Syntrophales bacterium]|nr:flagellar motor protein MotB [Syntrophales bacterium]